MRLFNGASSNLTTICRYNRELMKEEKVNLKK